MLNVRLRFALVFCGALLVAATANGDNWTRFRGPNGTGIVSDAKIPIAWTKDNILWKVKVPGDGNSSPVIWENRLFLQTAKPDGSRLLLCISVATGKEIWSRSLSGVAVRKHKKNTFASSTPAVDGKRVYAAFWDGKDVVMTAWHMNGKPAWQKNLGRFTSQHGAGASPIVYGDTIIFCNDQDGKSTLFGFDAKTGKIKWRKARPAFRACYGAPFLWERQAGKKELVVVSTKEITGYAPESGNLSWRWSWKHFTKRPLRVTGSPVFADDVVFASSGDGGGDRYMVAVRVNRKGSDADPNLAWSAKKDFPYVPTMLAYKGYLFIANDLGFAGCFEAKTGKQIWMKRISEVAFTSSPVIVNGKMYAANEDGNVFVLAAAPKFNFLKRNALGQRVRATPAIANNRMFIRGRNHLFCIGQAKSE